MKSIFGINLTDVANVSMEDMYFNDTMYSGLQPYYDEDLNWILEGELRYNRANVMLNKRASKQVVKRNEMLLSVNWKTHEDE